MFEQPEGVRQQEHSRVDFRRRYKNINAQKELQHKRTKSKNNAYPSAAKLKKFKKFFIVYQNPRQKQLEENDRLFEEGRLKWRAGMILISNMDERDSELGSIQF